LTLESLLSVPRVHHLGGTAPPSAGPRPLIVGAGQTLGNRPLTLLNARACSRLVDWGVTHWADPQMTRPGETNTEHGGRGVYFKDPAGHAIELITQPYQ
jgi:hypothetical protein